MHNKTKKNTELPQKRVNIEEITDLSLDILGKLNNSIPLLTN